MNTNKRPVFLLVVFSLVLLACSRTEPEIVAEPYPPEVGPVIPPPHQGGPDPNIAWFSEPATIGYDPAAWDVNSVGMFVSTTDGPASVEIALTPPNKAVIRCVRVAWIGAPGHASLPENAPTIAVWRTDLDAADAQLLGQAKDLSPDVASYEKPHQIEICMGLGLEPVDLSRYKYHATVFGEHGAGALPGSFVVGVRRGDGVPQ